MMAKLGDIATYINGYAFKPSDWSDEGLPIIRIQDLTGNSYKANRYKGEYNSKYEVNAGDVLISWSASLGVYVWSGEKAVLNQHIFKVLFDKVDIDKNFFVFQVQNILENAASEAHGATMKHLTKPVFDALPFNLPSLEEQKEISSKLNAVNDLIIARGEQLSKLDELIKSRFIEMFGDPNSISSHYESYRLSDIFDLQMGKTPDRNDTLCWGEGSKWVSIRDIGEFGKYTGDTKETITEYGVKTSGIKLVPADTVIMSFKLSIGKTSITTEPVYTNEAIMAFIDKKVVSVNTNYLYALFSTKDWSLGANKAVMGLTLNKATLSNIRMNVPPISLQNQFSTFVEQVDKSKYHDGISCRMGVVA